MRHFQVENKCVVIAGASKGLGKEFALELAKKGANIVLLARSKGALEETRIEVLAVRKSEKQTVDYISVDLTNPLSVETAFRQCPQTPDILLCVAGGTSTQMGFLSDISPSQIKSCLENNYYTAAFCAQVLLKRWIAESPANYPRHIVFTSSTAAFVGLPGYIAYTPAKTAVRALADTLRQELLLYGDSNAYQVHCCFPGTFISEGFVEEQKIKPLITRRLEDVDAPIEELEKTKMSSLDVARKVIAGLEKGDYFVTVDFEGSLLLNNMRGPSPRDRPFYDFWLGLIAMIAWFFVRRDFDKQVSNQRRVNQSQGGD